jgi:VWFA-related protein
VVFLIFSVSADFSSALTEAAFVTARSRNLHYNAPGTACSPGAYPTSFRFVHTASSTSAELLRFANVWHIWVRSCKFLCVLSVCWLFAEVPSKLVAQQNASAADPQATPSSRIDLSAIGFHEPSRTDRIAEYQPSLSLDFIDRDHVLLTFNRKQLVTRLPECTPDHEDRLMHAAILEVPIGKIVTEVDWYLHDRRRYIWPLSAGMFLLRRWNKLYIVDSNLHETLLLSSPRNLLWVSVTPDASQIITETENDKKDTDSARGRSSAKPEPKFAVQFLDVKTLATQRTLLFNNFTNLAGTNSGYADVIRKGDIWLLRFGPSVRKRRNLARVRSQTVPVVLYPTENTLIIGRCANAGCNYGVTAFTLTGHRLWRQHLPGLRSYPEITRSGDNSRFGVSTLRVERVSSPPDLGDEQDDPFHPQVSDHDVLRQEIQVFETATGNSVLSVSISPAVVTGQNVSLSPDGRHLALLRGSALELFDLPPISEEEHVTFASLQADATGLYALGGDADSDSTFDNTPAVANGGDESTMTADAPSGAAAAEKPDSEVTPHTEATGQPPSGVPSSPSPSPVADAAEKTAPAEVLPVPTFKVSTKAVVVDVVVTDNKGSPVRGLSQQDFQITEDNHPQSTRYFREFNDVDEFAAQSQSAPVSTIAAGSATLASTTPSPAPPVPSPNVFNNRARSSREGAVTMVLFDMLNTPASDQVYARQQLIKFLESKPKMSQFALCALSSGEHPLRLIQGFTADETLLLAAAKGKRGQTRNNRWQASATEVQNSLATVTGLAIAGGRTSGFQNLVGALQNMQAEQYVTDTSERASRTIDAMMLLARYLSGISGRKNMVWLSASFPIALSIGPISSNPSIDNPNYTYKIKRATNLLADAQVAVYPVDVRGLQVFSAGLESGAGVAGPRSFDPPDPTSPNSVSLGSGIPQGMDFVTQAAEQDTLNQFAVATGGKAFFNTNDIREAIATANEQGSNYYSFSYTSTNKVYNGKFRKIKVQLARKGYKLYYRQGYFADEVNVAAREAQLARNAITTAMQFGSPPAREVQLSVRVYPVGGKKKVDRTTIGEVQMAKRKSAPPPQVEVQHYVIDYTLDASALRFVPLQSGALHNNLALMISSFGTDGRMLAGMSTLAKSDLQPEVYKRVIAGDIGFQEEVDIPVEAISMRLAVQDQMSGHLGTVDVPLPVPPDPNAPRIAKNKLPEIEPD